MGEPGGLPSMCNSMGCTESDTTEATQQQQQQQQEKQKGGVPEAKVCEEQGVDQETRTESEQLGVQQGEHWWP